MDVPVNIWQILHSFKPHLATYKSPFECNRLFCVFFVVVVVLVVVFVNSGHQKVAYCDNLDDCITFEWTNKWTLEPAECLCNTNYSHTMRVCSGKFLCHYKFLAFLYIVSFNSMNSAETLLV